MALAAPALILIASVPASAQGSCPDPHGIAVAHLGGQVFDAFGIEVPFATVTVLGIHGSAKTNADDTGRFTFNVPPGHYVLKAEAEGFAYSSTEVKVGWSLQTIFRRQSLRVMLGFDGSFCPWVTTNKKNFQETAQGNMTRLKQSAQIQETPQSNETSKTSQAGQSNVTSQTKETSHTNATQK